MSTYDELVASARAHRRKNSADGKGTLGFIELEDLRRIAGAMDRARALEGQPVAEHFVLPDYAGQTAPLMKAGEKIGDHGLVVRDSDRHYLAHFFVPGRALALVLTRRTLWRDAGAERQDASAFGPEVDVAVPEFARRFVVRCQSNAQVAAFLTEELVGELMRARKILRRITLEAGLEGVHVDVLARADTGAEAIPAIALARAVHGTVQVLAQTAGGFVGSARTDVSAEERLPELAADVSAATAFLAGHVERVGDAVEARMELDDPAGWKGALRVAFASDRSLSVVFHGELQPSFTSTATLRPQLSLLERARGVFDRKIGHAQIDQAFLIQGNQQAAQLATTDVSAALALVARAATLRLDGAGLHVTIDDLPDEDEALLEAISASLALWRAAAHAHTGLHGAKAAFD